MNQPAPQLPEKLDLEAAVEALLAGADVLEVLARYQPDRPRYLAYLDRQRKLIREHSQEALQAIAERIRSSERVAYAKLLQGEGLHRPFVEGQLRAWARRIAPEVGLEPAVAEDLVLLLLAKSRAAQEKRTTAFAAALARAKRVLSPSEAPAGELHIDPISSRSEFTSLAREADLCREYRLTPITPEFTRNFARFRRLFPSPHRFIRRGLVVAMRDFNVAWDELKSQRPVTLAIGISPGRKLHLGDAARLEFAGWLGAQAGGINLVVSDLQALSRQGLELEAAARFCEEELRPRLARFGLADDSTRLLLESNQAGLCELALQVGREVPQSTFNAAFGLDLQAPAVETFAPLLATAGLLLPAVQHGQRSALVASLAEDVHVRLARRWAEAHSLPRPVALYLRQVASLKPWSEPASGAYVDAMSGLREESTLFLDDSPETVAQKLQSAVTGGGRTKAEHRRLGGNPDTRLCSIAALLAFWCAESDEEFAQITADCRAGKQFCADCKRLCLERLDRLPLDAFAD